MLSFKPSLHVPFPFACLLVCEGTYNTVSVSSVRQSLSYLQAMTSRGGHRHGPTRPSSMRMLTRRYIQWSWSARACVRVPRRELMRLTLTMLRAMDLAVRSQGEML